MCGIAGAIDSSGRRSAVAESVSAMVAALRHRGPDARGIECPSVSSGAGLVCLGHTRLAVIDTRDRAAQPMLDPTTGNWIVFNGEIYNFAELADHPDLRGLERRTRCDTEIVLQAYGRWGRDCVDRFQGMFAMAVWDADRQELWCARDRLGIKPFYYAQGSGRFLFASEVRALAASGRVASDLDPTGVAGYLQFGSVQEPHTILRDVRVLPPGHWMRVDASGRVIQQRSYWSLQDAFETQTTLPDDGQWTGSRLLDAVESRLVADVPLGIFLSGGIDSSAVTALAAHAERGPVKTFAVTYRDRASQAWNEAPFARLVAGKLGTDHAEIELAEDEVLGWIPRALAAMDQPTVDGVNTWMVAWGARAAGVTVALSGVGGDELFAGYPSFRHVPHLSRLAALGRALPRPVRAAAARACRRLGGQRVAARKLAAAWTAGRLAGAYGVYRRLFLDDDGVGWPGRRVGARDSHNSSRLPCDAVNAVSLLELSHYMRNTLLRDTDVMGMAHGLEIRVPFLDHRLVEHVASLPGRAKMPFGRSVPKPLLVGALGELLPPAVARRRKMGFVLPFQQWLRGPLAGGVADALNDRNAVLAAGLRPQSVRTLWQRFSSGDPSVTWSRVWALHVLVDWANRFAGQAGRAMRSQYRRVA